jgi:hypothetical protein
MCDECSCSPIVLAVRDRFQVSGVDAGSVEAKMVDDESVLDVSVMQGVGEAVRTSVDVGADHEESVSVVIQAVCPGPALSEVWA